MKIPSNILDHDTHLSQLEEDSKKAFIQLFEKHIPLFEEITTQTAKEYKKDKPGGYSLKSVYIEEVIDQVWDIYLGGDVEEEIETQLESMDSEDEYEDHFENIYEGLRKIYEQIIKTYFLNAGIAKNNLGID